MITGWQNILAFTGLSKPYLIRAMRFYGFPIASRTARQGRGLLLAWDQGEVEQWMTMNAPAVMEQKAKRLKFDHAR